MLKSRVLLIDVSNFFTKIAVQVDGILEIFIKIHTSNLCNEFLYEPVDFAIISSVVPSVNQFLEESINCRIFWLNYDLSTSIGIKMKYPHSQLIGSDRLANIIASVYSYPLATIIVDCGTAITVDVLDEGGYYLGGIIAPGLRISAMSLQQNTALLPLVHQPDQKIFTSIGQNTESSIHIGLLFTVIGFLKEAISTISQEFFDHKRPNIILTGGDAQLLHETMSNCRTNCTIYKLDLMLTMKGLAVVAQHCALI